nr:hypothetical protein [Actinomycetota bacterium]
MKSYRKKEDAETASGNLPSGVKRALKNDRNQALKRASTSAKQTAANRENAQGSTGPKSDEGKSQSSLNSARHGMYATTVFPIRRGVFREDPEEVTDYVDSLVSCFAPRDPAERAHARLIALAHLRLRRLERCEVELISESGQTGETDELSGLEDRLAALAIRAGDLLSVYAGEANEVHMCFQLLARFLQAEMGDENQVENLWTTERTPATEPSSDGRCALHFLQRSSSTDLELLDAHLCRRLQVVHALVVSPVEAQVLDWEILAAQ